MGILAQEFLSKKSPKKKSGAQSGKGFKSAENIKDSGSSSMICENHKLGLQISDTSILPNASDQAARLCYED